MSFQPSVANAIHNIYRTSHTPSTMHQRSSSPVKHNHIRFCCCCCLLWDISWFSRFVRSYEWNVSIMIPARTMARIMSVFISLISLFRRKVNLECTQYHTNPTIATDTLSTKRLKRAIFVECDLVTFRVFLWTKRRIFERRAFRC